LKSSEVHNPKNFPKKKKKKPSNVQNLETLKTSDANLLLNERWGPPAMW
jgi:hypothetical protein